MGRARALRPHALFLPFPAQGHIAPLFHLAHALVSHNITVSFLNTDNNHRRILENITTSTDIRFLSFSDGLPGGHSMEDLVYAVQRNAPAAIENIVLQNQEENIDKSALVSSPVSVIISDIWFSFTQDIADKYGIPRVAFHTGGACALSLWHHMPPLLDESDFWERWRTNMATKVSVMEVLRMKDMPKTTLTTKNTYLVTQHLHNQIQHAKEHAAFVFVNTWHDLEETLLSDLDKEFSGKAISLGPLVLTKETHQPDNYGTVGSLWKVEERECLQWLDRQREQSVMYLSMGSLAFMSNQDVRELGEGLEKAGYPFLWVVREGMVSDSSYIEDLLKRCKDRVCIVKWAPQNKVLKHPSVGAFLTHCGWNSVSEALSYGVPMICLPFFGDQHCNRRFVCHVWKCGLELKDKVERDDVESAVKRVMDAGSAERTEIRSNAERIRQFAMDAVCNWGSSGSNFRRFVDFLTCSI